MTESPEKTTAALPNRRSDDPNSRARRLSPGTTSIIAVAAGLIAIVAAVLTPFLPVTTTTATITWPQGQKLGATNADITAPLVAQMAQDLDVTIPCSLLRSPPTDASSTILTTMPPAAKNQRSSALNVTADANAVTVTMRGDTVASAPRADVASDRCTQLHIFSSAAGSGARFVGLGPAQTAPEADRPQVAGLFTDIPTSTITSTPGLSARIVVDDRFDSSPSVIKWLVMIVGVLAAIVALAALAQLDRIHGYHRRVGGVRWLALLRPRVTDIAVTAILIVWHFLGAGSSDDGYILNMGRNAEHAGYLANYYRFYGIPEAPFDWYYDFLAHWSSVSSTGVWMRIPSLVIGLVSWFILSRVLLPRLGRAVRTSQWAMVTGAAVFLAFWLPMASGLRSEGVVVLGSLLTWWGVEQAIATRRMLPAAGAAFAAALTLATAPTGVIAVALLITGARPMLKILVRRRRESGLASLLLPLLAAPAIVVIIVFRDQTLASVFEAIRVRYTVGPTLAWYQELLRYYFLAVNTRDGSLVRRVPVLLLLVSLFVVLAIMLRRKKIRGVDSGPVWRVTGAVLITIGLLSLTPTKWTIQFGIFAGLAAALSAVACVAIGQVAQRNTRNLSILIAGLLVACAAAAAGYNAWPWSYDFGISWFDKAPVVAGLQVSSMFLVLAVIALVIAVWQHLRLDYVADTGLHHDAGKPPKRWRTGIASSPIAVIAVIILLAELAVFAKAAAARADTYSVLKGNVHAVTGGCGMADYVLVEPDSNKGSLAPVDNASASKALEGTSRGFSPQGVADDLTPEADSIKPGTQNTSADLSKTFVVAGGAPGTTGGRGPEGVNGSTAALPFGLDPATTPVMGSYAADGQASLTTDWYRLPARDSSPLIVITAAGALASTDPDGVTTYGQSLQVEFGVEQDGKFQQVGAAVQPIDADRKANRPWRNLRIPMSSVPAGATAMRIVATDNNLDPDQWLAVTPPRAPELKTLQNVVGSSDPVLVDFAVGAAFPCQHPMDASNGVNQIPQWRILPELAVANSQSKTWMATVNGGLLTTAEALTTPSTMATYLKNDWYRDWGSLQRLSPLVPEAVPAAVSTGTSTRWGWSRPGAMQVVPEDDE
ncbi:arabinosyltransferase domain-containing protein [Gordonia sp. 852002-51296_SCH5728562-b]|uniref:arabinosyltransferase domain-containing protein n=1 Tax=Gordonia sp. 852002-51296_SCH5728562-b TaxID=1834101 RepID=UPI0007E9D0FC|nr:arabinosyltransferase domain-containing protein [Gordonia sp. 852002-51296_SCH5728562-b]OBA41615.1 cell shape-determining protein MreD [Gordonia sp. 852002-51296_SCH5728562-b]